MSAKVVNPVEQARDSAALVMKSGGALVHISGDTSATVHRLMDLCGSPERAPVDSKPLTFTVFIAELSFGLINFCYWQGDSSQRPGGDASDLRERILAAFGLPPWPTAAECLAANPGNLGAALEAIAVEIECGKLPLAVERASMLRGLVGVLDELRSVAERCANDAATAGDMAAILCTVPGFTGDVFHKRLLFTFMMLYRIYGRCGDLASSLPAPADYQIPKVLRAANAITYEPELAALIDSDTPIKAHSIMEIEIRAATIVAVERIARHLGLTEEHVDEWLWSARNMVPGKHHLSVTKDY